MSNLYSPIVILSILALYFDFRYRRLPNWLTFSGIFTGLSLAFFYGGLPLLFDHFAGLIIMGLPWLFFWGQGITGGGDQKFMMAMGALVGQNLAVPALLLTAIAGGVQSLIWIGYHALLQKNQRFFADGSWKKITLPYSPAIVTGVLLAWHFF